MPAFSTKTEAFFIISLCWYAAVVCDWVVKVVLALNSARLPTAGHITTKEPTQINLHCVGEVRV